MASSSPTLHLYIDYGTKHLCVGASIVASESSVPECRLLALQGISRHLPQTIGFDLDAENGRLFAFGEDLVDLQTKSDGHHFVLFERMKMLLFPSIPSDSVARIQTTLARLTPDVSVSRLFELHFAAIRDAAMAAAERTFRQPLNNLPVRTYFAVPEFATPRDTQHIGPMLVNAGFVNPMFISETEAAGAWYCHRYSERDTMQQRMLHFADGDELLVVDAGGSTCNVASFSPSGTLSGGARLDMRATGRTNCTLHGSESVTDSFQKHVHDHIRKRYDIDLKAFENFDLGGFNRQISVAFESFKIRFREERTRSFGMSLPTMQNIVVTITSKDVQDWIDVAFEGIKHNIEGVGTERVKFVVLTGGFFLSKYLDTKLRDWFGPGVDVSSPATNLYNVGGESEEAVVKGMNARFWLAPTKTVFPYRIGTTQDERWDRKFHTDITSKEETTDGFWEDDQFVQWRWVSLLGPEDLVDSHEGLEKTVGDELWMDFYLTETDNVLIAPIYYTKLALADHDPTHSRVKGTNEYGKLLPGIFETSSAEKVIDAELLRQYPLQSRDDQRGKEPAHVIPARLRVKVTGLSSNIEWEIRAPHGAKKAQGRTIPLGTSSLGNASFGAGIRRGPGHDEHKDGVMHARQGRDVQQLLLPDSRKGKSRAHTRETKE